MIKASSLLLALVAGVGLTPVAQAQNVEAGQQKAAMCIGCHGIVGYQATFPEVYKVPKISGQGAAYLSASLTAYAKGERKHPTMRGISATLTDQDIADLAAYYEQHGKATLKPAPAEPPAPAADVAALLAKGACASCHGANLSKPIAPAYPKIAGQHADYLYAALVSYQTEGKPTVGRANGVMAGQVKQFSKAELKTLAKYIASLPGELQTVPQSKFR